MLQQKKSRGFSQAVGFLLLLTTPLSVLASAHTDFLSRLGTAAFQGTFEQTVSDAKGQVLEKSQGALKVLKPAYFDWEITSPYAQRIVNDGKIIWSYDVEFAQITQFNAAQSLRGTPVQLLAGDPQALGGYTVKSVPCQDACFELYPVQEEAPFQKLQFTFDAVGIAAIEMIDSLNQKSYLRFTSRETSPRLQPKDFYFSPPEGVDVIKAQS